LVWLYELVPVLPLATAEAVWGVPFLGADPRTTNQNWTNHDPYLYDAGSRQMSLDDEPSWRV